MTKLVKLINGYIGLNNLNQPSKLLKGFTKCNIIWALNFY